MESKKVIENILDYQKRIQSIQSSEPVAESIKTKLKEELSGIIAQISVLPTETLIKVSQEFNILVTRNNLDDFFNTGIIYTYIASHIVAFALQINWHLDELSTQLNVIKKVIRKYLDLDNQHFFSFKSTCMRNKKQYLGKQAYLKLKFFLIYIETLLQHTAVLSQQGKHKKALNKASDCFGKLKVGLQFTFNK